MTRTEDRLIDALQAKAALIAPRASCTLPEPRPHRRAPALLAPLGAAAAVVLVAVGAIFLASVSRPVPASPTAGSSPVPRYYVQGGAGPITLQVRSVATGRVTGQLDLPSKSDYFSGVAAAPGNRTFYVQVSDGRSRSDQTAIYSFRVTQTGKATPLHLVMAGLGAASHAGVPGLAVSPDGARLVVMADSAPARYQYSDTLVVIDLRTGAQRQWRDPRPSVVQGTPMGFTDVGWLNDQTVVFTPVECETIWLFCGLHTGQVRTLNVASAGGSLTGSSPAALDLSRYPDAVQALPDQQGHFVLLEVSQFDDFSKHVTVTVAQVSALDGSSMRVLYRQVLPLGRGFGPSISADPSGQHLLVYIEDGHYGRLDRGELRPLPGLLGSFSEW